MATETPKLRILLTSPGDGTLHWGSALGLFISPSIQHKVEVVPSHNSGGNFNSCWMNGLRAGMKKEIDIFAMLHTDISPQQGWLDLLVEELLAKDAELVSTSVPLKGTTGLDMTAIGYPNDPWHGILRAFTQAELTTFPETFNQDDIGYAGHPFFCGMGCFVADMRKPLWYRFAEDGTIPVYFHYRERVAFERTPQDPNGDFYALGEGEDWNFCRLLWKAGGRNYVTKRVHLGHTGRYTFQNYGGWGMMKHDERTRPLWDRDGHRGNIPETLPKANGFCNQVASQQSGGVMSPPPCAAAPGLY